MELNPLKQIDPPVIASVIVIFTATHFVLRRTFLVPVVDVMERRRARLDEAEAQRNEAADVSRAAEQEVESITTRARERAERVGQSVRERAHEARRTRLEAVRAETATYLEAGRREIAEEREAELSKLRTETAGCVTLACERLLGGVDPHTVDGIVDRLVSRRVH